MKAEIFKLALSMSRINRDYQAKIDKMLQTYRGPLEIPTTISLSLLSAQNELKAMLKVAVDERTKFLQEKQVKASMASNPKEATKWKNQQKAEEIKAMYKKLRLIRQDGTRQQGLTSIEVPIDPTDDTNDQHPR